MIVIEVVEKPTRGLVIEVVEKPTRGLVIEVVEKPTRGLVFFSVSPMQLRVDENQIRSR
jgi:hypothetical protein